MNIPNFKPRYSYPTWIRFLFLIGLFFLITRFLLDGLYGRSAVLYVLVPYVASVLIYYFIPRPEGMSKFSRFLRHMLSALVVMLGTSALLFEGFICVLMFMPIYMFFSALSFAVGPDVSKSDPNMFKVSFVPLVVLVLSLEGISATLSFDREESISRTQIVDASIDELKANMAMPFDLTAKRSAFLSLFPLPVDIQAGSLNPGDIHKMRFIYKRWGVTNVHEGETWVKISEVSDTRVRTEMIKDTSYFSKYLTIKGTQVDMKPLGDNRTEVTLTVEYRRLLDPVWYFGPLQRTAVGQSADYLIENIIARMPPDHN